MNGTTHRTHGIGHRVARTEDAALLTGRASFLDDLRVRAHVDALHAVFVTSPLARARIMHIDTAAAAARARVAAVCTATDLDLAPLRGHHMLPHVFDRPPLATTDVRFAGEPVAVVVADSRAAAVDAAEHVVVELEPIAASTDPDETPESQAPLLFPAHGSNIAFERVVHDEQSVLAGADVVIRARFENQRLASAPMEPDGALAVPSPDGLDIWASTQRVHHVRDAVATSLGLAATAVRVRAVNVGGGFGGKFEPSAETVVVAAMARRLGRAVVWAQTRTENLVGMPHGRGQVQNVAIGLRNDGTLVGFWADVLADAGAYPMVGALVPNATLSMIAGGYRWSAAGGSCRSVATTTTPVGAYRGAGRPEATAAIERSVDLAAHELGIDPLELRRRNVVPVDEFPHETPTGMVYDSGDYRRCLDEAARRVGYDEVRRAQRAQRAQPTQPPQSRRRVGVGVALWVDCTPMNRPGELASVRILHDDTPRGFTIEVRDGANDQGQSHQTTWGLILADRLGVPLDAVHLYLGDTAEVAAGEGTGSARSLQLAGNAVARASELLLDDARAIAADLLEAAVDDIRLDDAGRFAVRGSPTRSVGWSDVVASTSLETTVDFVQPGPTFPSGAHAAVVEVDVETGAVEVLRFVAVDDCGTVVNPVAVEGQQHGGIVQGIGQALFEAIQHDADGTPRTTSFADYLVPSAAEVCSIDASTIDHPSPVNPLGAKGIGQAGAIGAPVAVQNAVLDALEPLGVRHIDLPLTPERVWRAIHHAHTEPRASA